MKISVETNSHSPIVLVCDDDADARAIISQSLEAVGCSTIQVVDGFEAQIFCEKQVPHLIVLDLMMPRVTGQEFLTWLRARPEFVTMPVLVLSALADVHQRVEGLAIGADDYLTKPFHYRELQARVQALLRARALSESLRIQSAQLQAANAELLHMQQALVEQERAAVAAQVVGAAAHGLGQPVTSVLLHCHLIERALQTEPLNEASAQSALECVRAIRKDCETVKTVIAQLEAADPNHAMAYINELKILDVNKK